MKRKKKYVFFHLNSEQKMSCKRNWWHQSDVTSSGENSDRRGQHLVYGNENYDLKITAERCFDFEEFGKLGG
jgi:hypothetical protein